MFSSKVTVGKNNSIVQVDYSIICFESFHSNFKTGVFNRTPVPLWSMVTLTAFM